MEMHTGELNLLSLMACSLDGLDLRKSQEVMSVPKFAVVHSTVYRNLLESVHNFLPGTVRCQDDSVRTYAYLCFRVVQYSGVRTHERMMFHSHAGIRFFYP